MRTYPYMDGNRLIELVERREYDGLSLLAHELATKFDAAQLENDRLKVLIARLHHAISARMCADEPTGEERLELHRAWQKAGAVLDQFAAPVGLTTDNNSNVKLTAAKKKTGWRLRAPARPSSNRSPSRDRFKRRDNR